MCFIELQQDDTGGVVVVPLKKKCAFLLLAGVPAVTLVVLVVRTPGTSSTGTRTVCSSFSPHHQQGDCLAAG